MQATSGPTAQTSFERAVDAMRAADAAAAERICRRALQRHPRDGNLSTRRVFEHWALPWQDSCLRFHENRRAVRIASSEQVPQPLSTNGMQRLRDYETQLAPLTDVLAPLLRRLPREHQPRSLWSETAA